MSDSPESTEDAVANALANSLHAIGVEALVLLSLKDGKVTRRLYGDPQQAAAMAVRYAAKTMTDMAENMVAEAKEVTK